MELTVLARWGGLVKCSVAIVSVLTVLACTRQTSGDALPPSAPQPWSGPLEGVTVVWSADPGIDLATGPAVVVRAYLESYELALDLGSIRVTYPGFARAVVDSAQPGDPWPFTRAPRTDQLVGALRWHLLRIDTNGRSVSAVVCRYSSFTSANDLGNGSYGYPPGLMDDGIGASRIGMTAPETPSRLPPQRGPALAPVDDVFGGWRVYDRRVPDSSDLSSWPTANEDLERCRDRAPVPLERREFLRQGKHPRSDYPTLPAYPGWPAAPPS